MRATLPKMPQSVQQTLGPEAADDLSQWIEVIVVEHVVRSDEYREVLSRLDILEHDVSDVKARIADLHRTMDERFDRMNSEMNEHFDQMYGRMTTMIRWTVGMLALFGIIMAILMVVVQFI